jgi:hypothetical protein
MAETFWLLEEQKEESDLLFLTKEALRSKFSDIG